MSEQAAALNRRAGSFLAVGFAGGLLAGLFGVGGGVVLVPLMVSALGIRQHLAHGTSLAIVTFTALIAGVGYAQQGFLPPDGWVLAVELAIGSIIGVNLGARIMTRVPARPLRQIFGVFMILVGLRLALVVAEVAASPQTWRADTALLSIALILVLGVVVGILSGMLGVGGGVFMVPLMVLLLGVPQHIAQGVSLAVIVPTGLFGSYAHYRRGNVDVSFALWIGLGSVVAALIGSQIVGLFDGDLLRRLFGLLLIGTGARMLWPNRG